MYHINPAEFGAAPIDMNTGDVLGDMYFDIRTRCLAIECADANNYQRNAHTCENAEVASPDLVITALELQVLTPFGPYGGCNLCENHTDHHGNNSEKTSASTKVNKKLDKKLFIVLELKFE